MVNNSVISQYAYQKQRLGSLRVTLMNSKTALKNTGYSSIIEEKSRGNAAGKAANTVNVKRPRKMQGSGTDNGSKDANKKRSPGNAKRQCGKKTHPIATGYQFSSPSSQSSDTMSGNSQGSSSGSGNYFFGGSNALSPNLQSSYTMSETSQDLSSQNSSQMGSFSNSSDSESLVMNSPGSELPTFHDIFCNNANTENLYADSPESNVNASPVYEFDTAFTSEYPGDMNMNYSWNVPDRRE
jgi:hypothetical protein